MLLRFLNVCCVPVQDCVLVYTCFSTLVFVGSVDREACSILFAQGLKKHMVLARERCDMRLLKASWPARFQPWDHESTKHLNMLYIKATVQCEHLLMHKKKMHLLLDRDKLLAV